MLLFSTVDRPDPVQSALSYASRSTGVDFDYLLATAQRESNLDPQARAATSTASGLFQFIESTWLETLKAAGSRHGYGDLAARIEPAQRGGYQVSDPAARQEILALRHDPKAAALMAGELTRHNADQLKQALGRAPAPGELYMAHFLGARGATELVRLVATAPQSPAAQYFPAAAKANRPIFYTGDGHARSAREVYADIMSRHSATQRVTPEGRETLTSARTVTAHLDQVFHGLFSDRARGGGLGPMARAAGTFWTSLFSSPGQAEAAVVDTARNESAGSANSSPPAPAAASPANDQPGGEPPWRWVDPALRVS